jgi:putative Holliday junction resolvase
MKVLALDIGNRSTGVAYFDETVGFPFPLDPIVGTDDETVVAVATLLAARAITHLVIGLPLLLDGSEGAQAARTRALAKRWERAGLAMIFVDERYTSSSEGQGENSHAKAAVSLLQMALDRKVLS